MDKTKNTNDDSNNLTHDDIDMLKAVLQKVRGSYPDEPYLQADFMEDAELEA